jgi:hypothetical protein
MNIMMPEVLAEHLKTVPNKSRYIAEALEERIGRERSRALRAQLAEAYASEAGEGAAADRDWSATLSDGIGSE